MKVYVLRHGDTEYKQKVTTLAEADDLTSRGIDRLGITARDLAHELDAVGHRTISIRSSPFGRALHSAKVERDTLQKYGIKIEEDIVVDQNLREVDNFDWTLFVGLVNGGELVYEEEQFKVDKEVTNPRGLPAVRFFREDQAHKLSAAAFASLPARYAARIKSFEPYTSVTQRLDLVLESLADGSPHLLVGHEGYTGRYVEAFNQDKNVLLSRGKYIVLEKNGRLWKPVTAQENAFENVV